MLASRLVNSSIIDPGNHDLHADDHLILIQPGHHTISRLHFSVKRTCHSLAGIIYLPMAEITYLRGEIFLPLHATQANPDTPMPPASQVIWHPYMSGMRSRQEVRWQYRNDALHQNVAELDNCRMITF